MVIPFAVAGCPQPRVCVALPIAVTDNAAAARQQAAVFLVSADGATSTARTWEWLKSVPGKL